MSSANGTMAPPCAVAVDGVGLTDAQRRRLVSVRVASRLSQPTQCELAFACPSAAAADADRWRLGAAVTVRVGAEPLFAGEVTCVEVGHGADGAAQVRLRCYDPLHRLRKRQQLRTFTDVDAAELARALVADLDLSVEAEEAGPRRASVVQHRQHDLDLLVGTAAAAGLHVVVDRSQLRLLTLAGFGEPVELTLGTSLLEVAVEANLDRVGRWVSALGWHPDQAEPLEERVDAARVAAGTATVPDPGVFGLDGGRILVDRAARTPEELTALAAAELDARAAGAVTATGVAAGDPRLLAGRRVTLRGVAASVAGTFVLTSAVHTMDARGHLTRFGTEPPEPPESLALASAVAVAMGKVVAVDDPSGLGRVRVALPGFGGPDGTWFGVVCAAAGPQKGIVALPDVDDLVLVVLPHGDPADGIVLGALFGTSAPPDAGVQGGAVRRWSIRTPGGQSVVLDDDEGRVRVGNEGGSFVDLGPDRVHVHAEADLVLEAPGRAITVRAAAVDFVEAAGS